MVGGWFTIRLSSLRTRGSRKCRGSCRLNPPDVGPYTAGRGSRCCSSTSISCRRRRRWRTSRLHKGTAGAHQEVSQRSDARRGATGDGASQRFGCLADGRACAGGDAGRHTLVRQAPLGCTCYPHQAYEARRFAHLQIARLQPLAAALPNGRPECTGSTAMLIAEMDAPVAANGHAAEIDILLNARLHVVALHLY